MMKYGLPHLTTVSTLLLVLSGCAVAPRTAVPEPTPYLLTRSEISSFATLLRLEDRREFDTALFAELTGSSSDAVRQRTALTLGRLDDDGAIPMLTRLLQDQDSAVAATAAFALGLIGDSVAEPALIQAVNDNILSMRPTVAAEAITALGEIGSGEGAEAIREVLVGLELDDPVTAPVANAALLAIWKFPLPADIESITKWTVSDEPETRWRAVYALVRRSTPAAARLLISKVNDQDERVRALAIRGLTSENVDSAGLTRSDVLPIVATTMNDSAYSVRINAARTLGSYSGQAAAAYLIEALDASDPHLRVAAIESLGRIGPEALAAAESLKAVSTRATEPVAIRANALLALGRVSPAAGLEVARQFSDSREWRLRATSAQVIARVAQTDSLLVRLMRDQDGRVAAAAVSAAISPGADSIRPLRSVLIGLLGHGDVMVRAATLGGLSQIADASFLPIFLDAYERAIGDEQNDAALAAVESIASLAEAGLVPRRAFFSRFSRSSDHLIRRRVQESFGALPENWGTVGPVETERSEAYYRQIVSQWIVPALATGEAPRVTIATSKGDIDLEMFPVSAPLTVLNFVSLAEAEYFDGQRWPRVVPNFVAQGGDPRGDMSGGPGYAIRDELNRHPYLAGTLGMALAGPDTGGSQFFITHSPQPHLDGGYTVFGQLQDGEEVVRRLLPGDEILTVRLTSVPDCAICTQVPR